MPEQPDDQCESSEWKEQGHAHDPDTLTVLGNGLRASHDRNRTQYRDYYRKDYPVVLKQLGM